MRILTLNSNKRLSQKETDRINDLVYEKHDKDFHYLAFDRQLTGFSSLGSFVMKNEELVKNEGLIMKSLFEKKEVCSLYPKEKLTLYPTQIADDLYGRYELVLDNIDKYFEDILKLNDEVYKTKYLFVDFGHGAENFDEELIVQKLKDLLVKSNILETIYIYL